LAALCACVLPSPCRGLCIGGSEGSCAANGENCAKYVTGPATSCGSRGVCCKTQTQGYRPQTFSAPSGDYCFESCGIESGGTSTAPDPPAPDPPSTPADDGTDLFPPSKQALPVVRSCQACSLRMGGQTVCRRCVILEHL
jgi:hypothetical protein